MCLEVTEGRGQPLRRVRETLCPPSRPKSKAGGSGYCRWQRDADGGKGVEQLRSHLGKTEINAENSMTNEISKFLKD